MASLSKPKWTYDVFLSFRGTELRNNFVSHFYQALNQYGIYTFRDSEELSKGDQISPALMKAIEESYIAIIIFSENYASSTWCLDETAKIMECKEQKDLMVFSVFYKVDPREVRGGRASYGRALAKHESKLGKGSERVKKWKHALLCAGNLSGWHLNDGDESEFIQEIVEEISNHLARTPLHVAKHPVGIKSQVVKLESMLNRESEDVLMIGLCGREGTGKSSLAKAIYNTMFRQFEGSSFLANVRETSKDSRDLVTLQEKILFEILKLKQRLAISSVDAGINLVRARLCRKKVLLILDDVDDLRQLNALAGEGEWFGRGSRIIITTRDKYLLTHHGIDQDHVYEVQALDDSEAHELPSKDAVLAQQKLKIKTDLRLTPDDWVNVRDDIVHIGHGDDEAAEEVLKERLKEGAEKAIQRNGKAPVVIRRLSTARPHSGKLGFQGKPLPKKATKDAPDNGMLYEEIQELKNSVNSIGRYLLKIEQAIMSLQLYNPVTSTPESSVATKSTSLFQEAIP